MSLNKIILKTLAIAVTAAWRQVRRTTVPRRLGSCVAAAALSLSPWTATNAFSAMVKIKTGGASSAAQVRVNVRTGLPIGQNVAPSLTTLRLGSMPLPTLKTQTLDPGAAPVLFRSIGTAADAAAPAASAWPAVQTLGTAKVVEKTAPQQAVAKEVSSLRDAVRSLPKVSEASVSGAYGSGIALNNIVTRGSQRTGRGEVEAYFSGDFTGGSGLVPAHALAAAKLRAAVPGPSAVKTSALGTSSIVGRTRNLFESPKAVAALGVVTVIALLAMQAYLPAAVGSLGLLAMTGVVKGRNEEAVGTGELQGRSAAADPALQQEVDEARQVIADLKDEVGKVMIGQQNMIDSTIEAMIAGEHVLLEGVPGIAKTTLVEVLAAALGAKFGVIQFTPDMLPKDITGGYVLEDDPENPGKKKWTLDPGPIMGINILLADEINRGTPKTQSALLRPMQHHKVSIKKEDFDLENPFLVLATQNPIEQEGTNYLPEAQQDRFMFKIIATETNDADWVKIAERMRGKVKPEVTQRVTLDQLMNAQDVAERITMDDSLWEYAINIRNAIKTPHKYGIGEPGLVREAMTQRTAIFIAKAARIHALMKGRTAVTAEDIRDIVPQLYRHRILLGFSAGDMTTDMLIREILERVPETKAGLTAMAEAEVQRIASVEAAKTPSKVGAGAKAALKWGLLLGFPAAAIVAIWTYWSAILAFIQGLAG